MKIAIFDSGAGGLTVLHNALTMLSNQEFIYFADNKHVPYGEKSPELVKKYVLKSIDFLAQQNIAALVIACNTATSLVVDELREKKTYSFPIFGVEPAIKPAVDQLKNVDNKKILLTGTKITIQSKRFKKLITRFSQIAEIDVLSLNKLVNWVENEQFNQKLVTDYLNKKVSKPSSYSAVVLGCTHFSFFKKEIQDFFGPQILIVDGNFGVIKHLSQKLSLTMNDSLTNNNQLKFYFSNKINQQQENKYRRLLARLN